MEHNQEFNRRLGGIRERFVLSLGEVDDDLRHHIRSAVQPQYQHAAMNAISAHAHRLRGLAPILGLTRLGEIAVDIEETILALDGLAPATSDVIDVVEMVGELRLEVAKLVS